MAYEQKMGDISVFQETDKKSERAPDWRGAMIVPEGVKPGDKLEVALWAKGGRGTMLAGSVKPPRDQQGDFRGGADSRGQAPVAGSRGDDAFDDSIPF